jgi:hypothetical protein
VLRRSPYRLRLLADMLSRTPAAGQKNVSWNKEMVDNMSKRKISVIAITIICIFSLSCNLGQRLAMQIGGLQGQVDSLTHVADPIEVYTPTSTITPTQEPSPQAEASPTDDPSQELIGKWSGSAQWLCDNNPLWSLILDFKTNGMVSVTLSGAGQTNVEEVPWILSGTKIEIHSPYNQWSGTVSGNTMEGTFADDVCNGVWSASRQ